MASKKKTAVVLSPRKNGLSKAARELLARVRVAASPEVIFGLEPAMAAAKVQSVVGPMIEGAGLPVALLQEYRWYVAELCRLMRMMSGPDLAYCMERATRKWLSLGLEPNTVVFLAEALFDRLCPRTSPDDALSDRGDSQARMTIETRTVGQGPLRPSTNEETAKDANSAKPEPDGIQPQRHEDTKPTNPNDEARMTIETRSPNDGAGADLTTKTQSHQEESGTGPLNDERGTDNEPTSGGSGP